MPIGVINQNHASTKIAVYTVFIFDIRKNLVTFWFYHPFLAKETKHVR